MFQPIVQLSDCGIVGFEALARWPAQPKLTPDLVFEAARSADRIPQLDQACREAAIYGALRAELPDSTWLFVNAEPAALQATSFTPGSLTMARAAGRLQLVLELTERSLLLHPSELLDHVASARAAGWRIALDDLGAHPDSLALLDLIMPDVIKLDLSLVQDNPTPNQARTLAAIMAHQERTGVLVLAEGIETDAHLEQALACGATLGQGWRFGRPEPFPVADVASRELPDRWQDACTPATPFNLAAGNPRTGTATKRLLIALSRHVEAQADNPADPPIVFAALQDQANLNGQTLRRYQHLSRVSPLVAVFGVGFTTASDTSIRCVTLDPDDPVAAEWTVVALGAQTAAALIAHDCGDAGPDFDRRFDFLITYDRDTVTEAARSLASRLA